MRKNKLIFFIICGVLLVVLVLLAIFMAKGSQKHNSGGGAAATVRLWTINDNSVTFGEYLENFKLANPQYQNVTFDITTFSSYQEYFYSLIGAFLVGNAPDIFVLNNNDSTFFDNQILPIENNYINVDNFRQTFEPVFSTDLIGSVDMSGESIQFLKGVPLGYEPLLLYYNFLYLKGKKLNTWSYVNDAITTLKNNNNLATVLGIGNGTTVYDSSDIFSQMLLLDNVNSIENIDTKTLQSSISSYFRYGDINQDNGYNYFYDDMISSGEDNLDLFSKGDLEMVIGYPSLINIIDENGYNKSFLRATTFPTYSEKSGKLLVNYNYFVINKNTAYPNFARELLSYFTTTEAQEKYLEYFPLYLPSNLQASSDVMENNIKDGYFIKYKDIYNTNLEYSSFNKGYKVIYDSELKSILDKGLNGVELFEKFQKRLLCLSKKMITQENLGESCE